MKLAPYILLVSVPLIISTPLHGQKADPKSSVGKNVGDFTLKSAAGDAVSLSQYRDKKAVAVIFLGTQCPLNNAYLPRLVELHKEFAEQGVQFLAINPNRQDSAADIAAHAKKHQIPFPVLQDAGNVIADRFGA